jgi:predicted helicase
MGYRPTGTPPRLSVYLTNSLEEGEPANQSLPFAQWLSNEVKQANTIKRDMPIMCVIGNPPYSGESANKGDWIMGLMEAYKKEPGSSAKLREKNPKWINKDEHKFIRMAEHLIEKTGGGIIGYISSHGYLDDPTIRGMRWHLLNTFNTLYVIDLHGNTNKKEVDQSGKPDKNVFDIMQGVSILIAVKRKEGRTGKLAKVLHQDVWGARESKYNWLWINGLDSGGWEEVTPKADSYFLKPFSSDLSLRYQALPSMANWFSPNGDPAPGIVTTHDQFAISWTNDESKEKVRRLLRSSSETEARSHFRLCSQAQWSYAKAKAQLPRLNWEDLVSEVNYRPFDKRSTVYNTNVAVHLRLRMTRHFVGHRNIGILTSRMAKGENFAHVFATDTFSEAIFLSPKTGNNAFNFPLYLYPAEQDLDQTRRVNFDPKLYARLRALATHPAHGTPDEVQVFDYIYGVLHCPAYRATYAEFLKIDFPRVPWPASPEEFWDVSAKGTTLRKLHLMDPATIGPTPYPFRGEGDAKVEAPRYADGKVWINKTQYFENVPEVSWTFFIGGYQPAQKWLKDRKGRELSFDDVKHYQKIIRILAETDRIMKTITMTLGQDV